MVTDPNYQIPSVNWATDPLNIRDFYQRHISQSEPLQMNNYAREWTVRKEISNAMQNSNLNDWFEDMFSSTIGGVEMK